MKPAPRKLAPVLFAAALIAAACSPAPDMEHWHDPGPGGPRPLIVFALETLPQAGQSPTGAAETYAALADARRKRLQDLQEYAQAGTFPTNSWHDRATPCFLGANGVYCAVGYLMVQDGQQATVDAIVAADNLIRLADHPQNLASDWIMRSGLTFEECALIQPSYEHMYPPDDDAPLPRRPQPEVGRQLTQERLLAVVRKLNQDTPFALQLALQRAFACGIGQGFQFTLGQQPAMVTNTQPVPMLVRFTPTGGSSRPWVELAVGGCASVQGAGLLEWLPRPKGP